MHGVMTTASSSGYLVPRFSYHDIVVAGVPLTVPLGSPPKYTQLSRFAGLHIFILAAMINHQLILTLGQGLVPRISYGSTNNSSELTSSSEPLLAICMIVHTGSGRHVQHAVL